MNSKLIGLRILLVLTVILAGCTTQTATMAPTTAPTATPTVMPTASPTMNQAATMSVLSTQVAGTVIANLTLTAPTSTPVPPTSTPSPTATATATYIRWTSTPYLSPTPIAYACSLTSVLPKPADTIKAGTDFDGSWVVQNTGTEAWLHNDVDIVYVSGAKFQTKGDIFDLKSDVASKGSSTVVVDMKAPADAGTYQAVWSLARAGKAFCSLNLTVLVVK
jgi:hypothetical protein